jgi:cysteine synthase A
LLNEIGCQLVAVVDPKVPARVRDAMRAAGALLEPVHERDRHGGYLLTRLARVAEMRARDPRLRWSDQYSNPANPDAHRLGTAIEIVTQTEGRLDALLAAVSTGGTLAGLSDGLRPRMPGLGVYAVDAVGSLVTSDVGWPHLLTGIGSTRKSSFLQREHYDEALQVTDVAAISVCRILAEDTGLALGGSGGAVVAAFVDNAERRLAGAERTLAVVADGAHNYLTTYYDDGWLAENGALPAVRAATAAARADALSFHLEDTACAIP